MIDPWEVFKALGDRTRLRLLSLLVRTGEAICVCEFVDSLEMPQYTVSKGLKILADTGIICQEREGKWIYYSLCPDNETMAALYHTVSVIKDPVLSEDIKEFKKRIKLREDGRCRIGIKKTEFA